MGKNMKHALAFISRYAGWHGYASDRATVDAVMALERKGLVETNKYQMFRITP